MRYPVPPRRIPRRRWGFHVVSVTDSAPDYFGQYHGLWSRLADSFWPFIVGISAVAISAAVTAIMIAISLA